MLRISSCSEMWWFGRLRQTPALPVVRCNGCHCMVRWSRLLGSDKSLGLAARVTVATIDRVFRTSATVQKEGKNGKKRCDVASMGQSKAKSDYDTKFRITFRLFNPVVFGLRFCMRQKIVSSELYSE